MLPKGKNAKIDIMLQQPEHYQMVEEERERLGYWGQDDSAPRYSVCVCNYNMADTLERAMTSVLDQLDRNLYEVVVIDDGSSDSSLDELEEAGKVLYEFSLFLFAA